MDVYSDKFFLQQCTFKLLTTFSLVPFDDQALCEAPKNPISSFAGDINMLIILNYEQFSAV